MTSPKVSVLLTTYNGARHIGETIQSILDQSFTDFELVVVDDGSSDDTCAIVAGFNDPRLRLSRAPVNLGVVGARNFGFRQLRGRYIATIDHDDLWRPARLQRGVALLDANPDTDLVGTKTAVLADGVIAPAERRSSATSMVMRWLLLLRCEMVFSSLLFRREAARLPDGGLVREALRYADDYDLMLRLSAAGGVAVIDEVLTIYRSHAANTTRTVGRTMFENATAALALAYARWLGEDAQPAAWRIAWHVSRGHAVASWAEMVALGNDITGLRDGFNTTYQPNPTDRAAIDQDAVAAYWKVLVASMSSGRVWLLACALRHPALVPPRRMPGDVVVAIAKGLVRLCLNRGPPPAPRPDDPVPG